MRFIALISLFVLICYSTALSLVPGLQQAHAGKFLKTPTNNDHSFLFLAGFCPMHVMTCSIYCPPTPISDIALFPRQIGGCKADSECAADEKCCRPACGCTNRCAKAVAKPGFQALP